MTKTKKELKRIRKTQMFILIIIGILALTCILCFPAADALTVTMANPGGIAERDIIVYFANGTMQGYYNSTSVITLDGSVDYIFTVKPLSTNPLSDPGDWLTNEAFPFVQSNVIALLVIFALLGYVASRGR